MSVRGRLSIATQGFRGWLPAGTFETPIRYYEAIQGFGSNALVAVPSVPEASPDGHGGALGRRRLEEMRRQIALRRAEEEEIALLLSMIDDMD